MTPIGFAAISCPSASKSSSSVLGHRAERHDCRPPCGGRKAISGRTGTRPSTAEKRPSENIPLAGRKSEKKACIGGCLCYAEGILSDTGLFSHNGVVQRVMRLYPCVLSHQGNRPCVGGHHGLTRRYRDESAHHSACDGSVGRVRGLFQHGRAGGRPQRRASSELSGWFCAWNTGGPARGRAGRRGRLGQGNGRHHPVL